VTSTQQQTRPVVLARSRAIWSLRRDMKDIVSPLCDEQVGIWVDGQSIVTDRRTARLLAKRLNQMLDATVKS
jgi:hypothetical protein